MPSIETIIANKDGWFTPEEAFEYYDVKRSLEEIVLHHWDSVPNRQSGKCTFQGTLTYLLNPQTHGGAPTASCVIGWDEASKRVRIVDTVVYPNVAFTSSGGTPQSLKNERAKIINAVSVGYEIDPLIEVEGPHQQALIEAVAYRVQQHRKEAGKAIPLTGHNTYVYTACPGAMPFAAINKAAAFEPATVINGDDMNTLSKAQVNVLTQIAFNRPATDAEKSVYHTTSADEVLNRILTSPDNLNIRTKAAQFENVQNALNVAYAQIEALRKEASQNTAARLTKLQADIASALAASK